MIIYLCRRLRDLPSLTIYKSNLRYIVNKNNCYSPRNHCKLNQIIRARCGCAAIPKNCHKCKLTDQFCIFGRGISNISEPIKGKKKNKMLHKKNSIVAKVKLFQLTPIRYAKSRAEADASFRITDGRCKARGLHAALLGFCSVIPSALRGISTRTW